MGSKSKKRKRIILTPDQWRAIRQVWEFSPDQPTYAEAASQAAEEHGFDAPSKQALSKRALTEGWQRRGSLAGINAAAHRIADRLGEEDERKPSGLGSKTAYNDPGARPDSAKAEIEERHNAELRRAEIRARHRREWTQIVALRQEALKHRENNPDEAFHRLKLGKIAAEITAIQQGGETKSWGMDETLDAGRLKTMTDQQLEALVAGKKVI